jgi:hypothetical protein
VAKRAARDRSLHEVRAGSISNRIRAHGYKADAGARRAEVDEEPASDSRDRRQAKKLAEEGDLKVIGQVVAKVL